MRSGRSWLVPLVGAVLAVSACGTMGPAGPARISEEVRSIATYGFSEPNPVPILTRDARLYPYHAFEGYEHESTPRDWKVVRLENDYIEVFVLPEVGGKVWGARVKKTGHEFIYRNEVLKFRNIALRGPWTSGGIEFNFGVIGHAPGTATPVDYALKQNPDGSVSCIVGTMDLPSRTVWRVEIRLAADRAAFDTNVLWHNPTPLEQPYYNWMTAAAFATDDLEMSIPGSAYLQHSGARETWPVDDRGRFLPVYRNNAFGGNKSFHVVGELNNFFGGYYRDAGYGFGHWARHEDMPGQKLWLWALSRSGGIWEDLLTDTDGQYVEYQAGRLLVQYAPGADVNPITQAGFDPVSTDRWTETWFPVEGIGGLTDASRDGAMSVKEIDGQLVIGLNAFREAAGAIRVWSDGKVVAERPVALAPLEVFEARVAHAAGAAFRVEVPALGLDYASDPAARRLSRPFDADPAARGSLPAEDRLVFDARELVKARRYDAARPLLETALAAQPWHRGALLALADLEYRRARYDAGLPYVLRALRQDAYDAAANFTAGNLYRALGRPADARDAFGWAARSMAFRSAANVQLADLALGRGDRAEAERYARIALDYDRFNLAAEEVLAIVGRRSGNEALASGAAAALLDLDPLNHFVRAERFLAAPSQEAADALAAGFRSEYPDQMLLELVVGYANRGLTDDARALTEAASDRIRNPLVGAWQAWLKQDPAGLKRPADLSFVFPYRRETLPVLTWAAGHDGHWTWSYLLALNLWALDRPLEAETRMRALGDLPDLAAFYVARAHLVEQMANGDPEPDLGHADRIGATDRLVRIPLIQYYQRRARWSDALSASARARGQFPGDFNLDLLHARSLVHLGRAAEAIAMLDATRVLPSEHARESHQLYAQAHTIAALDAAEAGRFDEATVHLRAALEWPEHLGQGRPYEPEERVVRFLLGRVAERSGRPADARAAFDAVVTATAPPAAGLARLDLLAIPALQAMGRTSDVGSMMLTPAAAGGDPGVRQLAEVLARGDATTRRQTIAAIVTRYPRIAGDLDGEILIRALSYSAR